MSKIGKKPIIIPENAEVKIEKNWIDIKGKKGSLRIMIDDQVDVVLSEGSIVISKNAETKKAQAIWGLTRSLISNAVLGVTEGYEKKLELQGVGFRMAVQGKKINLALGFSHPVDVEVPDGIEAKLGENNTLLISGIDKQAVGQFAAEIKSLKKAEPYKGKGFRYAGEHVRRKAGKKASSSK